MPVNWMITVPICALDGSKKTEVGLLVEISGNFSDLILFNDGEIASNRNGLLPLSDGLFERLFKALGGRSDDKFVFIILYRRNLWGFDEAVDMTSVMTHPVDGSKLRPCFQAEPVYYYIPLFLSKKYVLETAHDPTPGGGLDQTVEGSVRIYTDRYWALVRRVSKW